MFQRTADGKVYYYQNDHLGTPQRLIVASGKVVWEARYTAFGKATILTEEVSNNLRFPGQYYDVETGLHYNYFRDYDPSTGRYIESDPIGLAGGMNTYVFVGSNPISFIDPYGLESSSNPVRDAVGALTDAGYTGYAEAIQAKREAEAAASQVDPGLMSPGESSFMGPADAIRHCVLACSLTQRLGRTDAMSILNRHEDGGPTDLMDQYNNQMGCFIGENSDVGTCQASCFANMDDLMSYRNYDGTFMGRPLPISEVK
nr:RHS repeat-associated core domain-containing protein [Marinobacterium ramblicola]